MPRAAIGFFEKLPEAEKAAQKLRDAGLGREELDIMVLQDDAGNIPAEEAAQLDFEKDVAEKLHAMGVDKNDADALGARLRMHGGAVVVARDTSEGHVHKSAEMLQKAGAMALDEALDMGEPGTSEVPLEKVELPASGMGGTQTGRVRSRDDGPRVFVW